MATTGLLINLLNIKMAYDVQSQWDDIHRRLGNYSQLPIEKKQSEYTKENVDKLEAFDVLKHKEDNEIDELEDDMDEEFMMMYKEARL